MNYTSMRNKVMTCYLILFAIGLNYLFTLNIKGDDIRLASTDLLIPFVIFFYAYVYINKNQFPKISVPHGYLVLLIMSAWLTIALINGYYYTGTLSSWTLVNKFFGWFVLMLYMFMGVFIGLQSSKKVELFFRFLFIIAWSVCLYEIVVHWFFEHGFLYEYTYVATHIRIQGLYQNPNAYGIFLAVLLPLNIHIIRKKLLFRRWASIIGIVLLVTTITYTHSRSAWLGAIFGMLALLVLDWKNCFYMALSACLAVLFNFTFFSDYTRDGNDYVIRMLITGVQKKSKVEEKKPAKEVAPVPQRDMTKERQEFSSIKARVAMGDVATRTEMVKRSIGYWKENPLIGIGLGSHLWNSRKENIHPGALTIHSSANWLLVETGIIGLSIFSFFVIATILSLYRQTVTNHSVLPPKLMIVIIFVVLGASIGTEVLYQRYFWVLLGLSIANGYMNIGQERSR